MSPQPASMDAPIDEGHLVITFVEIFGDRSKSPFGTAISTLVTLDDLTWHLNTERLLQESVWQQCLRLLEESSQN